MHDIAAGKVKMETDAEVVRLARRLAAEYSRSGLLLKSLETVSVGNERLEVACKKLRMSRSMDRVDLQAFHNGNLKELMGIVALGVERSTDVGSAIDFFAKRLSGEIEMKNRIKAKSGGVQVLTYMGMGIFFPLFAGISAIIISGALGMANENTDMVRRNFLIIATAYVPIILYLTSAFAHPEKSFVQNLAAIFPYFLLAASIIFVSQAYLTNVI